MVLGPVESGQAQTFGYFTLAESLSLPHRWSVNSDDDGIEVYGGNMLGNDPTEALDRGYR
jgi:hypothetical protein